MISLALVLVILCATTKTSSRGISHEARNLGMVRKMVLHDSCYKVFMSWPPNYKQANRECSTAVEALAHLPAHYKDPKCSLVTSGKCRPQSGGRRCTLHPYRIATRKFSGREYERVDKDWIYGLRSCIEANLLNKWLPPRRIIQPPPKQKQGKDAEGTDEDSDLERDIETVRRMVLRDTCARVNPRRKWERRRADGVCNEAVRTLMLLSEDYSKPQCENITSGKCRLYKGGYKCTVHPYRPKKCLGGQCKKVNKSKIYSLRSCIEKSVFEEWTSLPTRATKPQAINRRDISSMAEISKEVMMEHGL